MVRRTVLEHNFNGSAFSIGVEEELMIVDPATMDLSSSIETLLEATADVTPGEVKPELMQSVLEIASEPCSSVTVLDGSLRNLRRQVTEAARGRGLCIGASGTHPFAHWKDQRIVSRPRYRDLVSALRFVARQELIFGVHVHVGIDGADKAIYVADGMRDYVPLLLGLSTNSPLWQGAPTGLMSTRTPIFRAFPRVGIPPAYGTWEEYCRRVEFLMESGVVEDYTYLWYDVRPHPNFGTVEVRVFDAQTRVEHSLALAALTQALMHKLAAGFEAGVELPHWPQEMIDENKVLAALHGLEGELIDLHSAERVPAKQLVRGLLEELAEHAQDLGCESFLEGIGDLVEHGTGARRQLVVFEANEDLVELMREIVEITPG
jgi:glutamate---cysteine ligase / carboxylate-amine ligase